MTWFKVDDRLWGHPKWIATSPRARALWITAGSWCAGLSNDGKVPRHVLRQLGGTEKDASALVTVGLWHSTRAGWEFHDWIDLQPDAATVEAIREKKSSAGEAGNHKRWHVRRNITVPGCQWCEGIADVAEPSHVGIAPVSPGGESPDPTRPDPFRSGSPSSSTSPSNARDASTHRPSLSVVPGSGDVS